MSPDLPCCHLQGGNRNTPPPTPPILRFPKPPPTAGGEAHVALSLKHLQGLLEQAAARLTGGVVLSLTVEVPTTHEVRHSSFSWWLFDTFD